MNKASVLYIPHGGGPMPLMGDPDHRILIEFLGNITQKIKRPEAIILISAHWEEPEPTITSGASPDLIFDYYGFPPETYKYRYPSPGHPGLSQEAHKLLKQRGFSGRLDPRRGFDHGHFVPLMLMYPDADIPTIQISLIKGLDPRQHIALGKSLQPLLSQNILILGSGFSFHNMRSFADPDREKVNSRNDSFHAWLNKSLTSEKISEADRALALNSWTEAPEARYCHPREEHLMPLHVCYGAAQAPAQNVFYNLVIGKRVSAFLWPS